MKDGKYHAKASIERFNQLINDMTFINVDTK